MNSDLVNPDGTRIPRFSKDISFFLNKSIILYGTTSSGKSTVMKDILHTLRDHIPNVCVICPTNEYNKDYTNIIPSQLIHTDVTKDLMQRIFNRQKSAVKLWNYTMDLKRLTAIFSKMPKSENDLNELSTIIQGYHVIKNKITNNEAIHIADKKADLRNLDEVHNDTLIAYYKRTITKNKHNINKARFSDLEMQIINFINIMFSNIPNRTIIYSK